MNGHSLINTIAFSAAVLLASGDVLANNDHGTRRMQRQIEACIENIGDRADYDAASRVVHTVTDLRQVNIVELEIVVETAVIGNDRQTMLRGYRSACITDSMGRLTRIRVRGDD